MKSSIVMASLSSFAQMKAILFDLDGTLLDTESLSDKALLFAIPGLSETIRESYSPSYKIPWQLKKRILGLRGSEWGPIVLQFARDFWDVDFDSIALPTKTNMVDELWTKWEKNLNQYCETEVQTMPGAGELVQQFATQPNFIPMAIATSSRKDSVDKKRLLHEESLFQYMSTIVTGDHPAVVHGKPAPDIYIEAARQLGVSPTDCLVFEDALPGVRSGKAAGCTVIAIPDSRLNEEERHEFEEEADLVINSLWEFDGTAFGLSNINMPLLLQKLNCVEKST